MTNNEELKNIYHQGFIDAMHFDIEQHVLINYHKLPKDDEFVEIQLKRDDNETDASYHERASVVLNKIKEVLRTDRVLLTDGKLQINTIADGSSNTKTILME